jgi:hypothetical protein
VDPPGAATPRFPRENAPVVRDRVRAELTRCGATAIVSAAACGADLLALEAAGELGVRRVVVLPTPRDQFRAESVVDRGDEWGPVYDRIIGQVIATGDLRMLERTGEGRSAFFAANDAILDVALELSRTGGHRAPVVALVAWDGRSRGADDVTAHFADAARQRGIPITEVDTLPRTT